VCVFTRLRFVLATYWDLSPCVSIIEFGGFRVAFGTLQTP
jgi:hypothetical protein